MDNYLIHFDFPPVRNPLIFAILITKSYICKAPVRLRLLASVVQSKKNWQRFHVDNIFVFKQAVSCCHHPGAANLYKMLDIWGTGKILEKTCWQICMHELFMGQSVKHIPGCYCTVCWRNCYLRLWPMLLSKDRHFPGQWLNGKKQIKWHTCASLPPTILAYPKLPATLKDHMISTS